MTTSAPVSKGARYTCASCSGFRNEKSRAKRICNESRNTALRQRLETFLKLPLEGHEPEWFDLAQELKVDAVALETLVAVVQEKKWQKSTAPLTFVRINVERRSEEWKDPFSEDGRLRSAQIFSTVPTREDRASLRFWARIQERSALVTSDDIEAASQILSIVQDEGERGVLCARASGLTRAQYLSGVSDLERRRRAAAWKRLNRHGIPSELRQALRGASGALMIMRPGFENRAWEDARDEASWDAVPYEDPAAQHDFEDED